MDGFIFPVSAKGKSYLKDAAGFSMVELLSVLVILACVTLLALPTYKTIKDTAREARAMEELRDLEKSINSYIIEKGNAPASLNDLGLRPGSLIDPWHHPYVYANIVNGDAPRKDIDTNPLNTDFDLYSVGSDGASDVSLGNPTSDDDVVRASNGGFVGRGDKF